MKKSLIALAALSAIAGSAVAQSSVTVYGVLDAGYSDISRDVSGALGTGTTARTASTESQEQKALGFNNFTSSRFGIRGSEDIGGGLSANFVVETGISSNPMAGFSQTALNRNAIERGDRGNGAATNGTTIDATSLGNRELNATLVNKNSGTSVKIGFGSTAIRDTVLAFDAAYGSNVVGNVLVNDAQFSSNRSVAAGVVQSVGAFRFGAAVTQNNADTTTDSAVTPVNGTTKTGTGTILNVGYAAGPLALSAAQQVAKTKTNAVASTTTTSHTAATSASSSAACTAGGAGTWTNLGTVSGTFSVATNLTSCATAAVLAADVKRTTNIVGGSYDAKVAKFYASYGSVKTNDSATVDAQGEGKRSAYVLGVQVPINKVVLFGTVSEGSVTEITTGATAAAGTDAKAAVKRDISGYQLGARYDLSKRTYTYAVTGQTKLDAVTGDSTNGFYNYGVKVQQTTIGLAHSF
jgi:predicted porin